MQCSLAFHAGYSPNPVSFGHQRGEKKKRGPKRTPEENDTTSHHLSILFGLTKRVLLGILPRDVRTLTFCQPMDVLRIPRKVSHF